MILVPQFRQLFGFPVARVLVCVGRYAMKAQGRALSIVVLCVFVSSDSMSAALRWLISVP